MIKFRIIFLICIEIINMSPESVGNEVIIRDDGFDRATDELMIIDSIQIPDIKQTILNQHEKIAQKTGEYITNNIECITFKIQTEQLICTINQHIYQYYDNLLYFLINKTSKMPCSKVTGAIHQYHTTVQIVQIPLEDELNDLNTIYNTHLNNNYKSFNGNNMQYKEIINDYIIQYVFKQLADVINVNRSQDNYDSNLLLKYLIETLADIVHKYKSIISLISEDLILNMINNLKPNEDKYTHFLVEYFKLAHYNIQNVILRLQHELEKEENVELKKIISSKIYLCNQETNYLLQHIKIMQSLIYRDFLFEKEILFIFIQKHITINNRIQLKKNVFKCRNIIHYSRNSIKKEYLYSLEVFARSVSEIHTNDLAEDISKNSKKWRIFIFWEYKKLLTLINDILIDYKDNTDENMLKINSVILNDLFKLLQNEIINSNKMEYDKNNRFIKELKSKLRDLIIKFKMRSLNLKCI